MRRVLNILVVEDYDALRKVIVQQLSQDGHQVLGVPAAEDVVDVLTGFVPDLYVLDLNLPGEDGISLAQRIRRTQPKAAIVMTSARTTVQDRVAGYQSGADVYMPKPLSLEELRAVIETLVARLSVEANRPGRGSKLHTHSLQFSGPTGTLTLSKEKMLLLSAFARAPDRFLERWQVAEHLGGGDEISTKNLEVKLVRLRKKLVACGVDAPAILAIRGQGYKLLSQITILPD